MIEQRLNDEDLERWWVMRERRVGSGGVGHVYSLAGMV